MEIYKNGTAEERRVYLDVPVTPTDIDVTAVRDGSTVYTFSTVVADAGRFYVTVPFHLSNNDSEFTIRWEFSYVEDGTTYPYVAESYVEVVTPILNHSEILKIHPRATPDEIVAIEKATRHIINGHCGQTFGRYIGKKRVRTQGGSALQLPVRLLSLTKVNGITAQGYTLEGDGWILRKSMWGVPPVKADAWGLHYHTGGVIHNPNNIRLGRFESREYEIEGAWGWNEIPSAVKEAAKLLINDYACADIEYRDRYLTSMTAADWRIQFHSGAFERTGNVRADQLLSDYVLPRGWVVI